MVGERAGGLNVKNNLVAEEDKLSDEDEQKLVSSQRLMDKVLSGVVKVFDVVHS